MDVRMSKVIPTKIFDIVHRGYGKLKGLGRRTTKRILRGAETKKKWMSPAFPAKSEQEVKDVIKEPACNWSDLMIASSTGDVAKVKSLLERSAINEQDDEGATALLLASKGGHAETVQLLLNGGALVDVQTKKGKSALMKASKHGHARVVQLLLDSNAQVNLQNKYGYSALIYSSFHGHIKVVELLLEHDAQVDMQNNFGMSVLMWASYNGHTEVVKLLLDHDAQVNMHDNEGVSALMVASQNGHTEVMKLLLDYKAQVNMQDHEGMSPIMKACQAVLRARGEALKPEHARNCVETVKLLLQNGAEVNLKDTNGKSALVYAVLSGDTDLTINMIESGAEIDTQDYNGWSPLMYAVDNGDLETVQCLVKHGVNLHLRDSKGKTIFDIWPQNLPLFQTMLSKIYDNLKLDSNYPGVVFFNSSATRHITSSPVTVGQLDDIGISVSVPENSLRSSKESLDFCITPCFSGPFELPDQYESASPAYLICHDKMDFQKDITVRMHHYACLQNEGDCEDMAFLLASSTPEYKGSHPVYTFKEILGVKGIFRPGDQVGEVSLRHFCFIKATRKRIRGDGDDEIDPVESQGKKHRGNCYYYSARLYRNVKHEGAISAVFCMCLYHRKYIEHCDRVMCTSYTGMSDRGEGRSQVMARILGDEVRVRSSDESCSHVRFDRTPTQIPKREIHAPELMNIEVSELMDYPPRLSIYVQQQLFSSQLIQVEGLDVECCFNIIPEVLDPPEQRGMAMQGDTTTTLKDQPEEKDGTSLLDDRVLGEDDLPVILRSVLGILDRWEDLGLALDIKMSELTVIEKERATLRERMKAMLLAWLRHVGKHPTWRTLCDALRDELVERGDIAKKIEENNHLTSHS